MCILQMQNDENVGQNCSPVMIVQYVKNQIHNRYLHNKKILIYIYMRVFQSHPKYYENIDLDVRCQGYMWIMMVRNISSQVNVREYRMAIEKLTTKISQQHRVHKTKKSKTQKYVLNNTIYVNKQISYSIKELLLYNNIVSY